MKRRRYIARNRPIKKRRGKACHGQVYPSCSSDKSGQLESWTRSQDETDERRRDEREFSCGLRSGWKRYKSHETQQRSNSIQEQSLHFYSTLNSSQMDRPLSERRQLKAESWLVCNAYGFLSSDLYPFRSSVLQDNSGLSSFIKSHPSLS